MEDCVAGHNAAMSHDSSLVVNFGTGEGTSVNEIFRHLRRLTGYDAPPVHGLDRPGDVRHITLDPSKAKRVLGWEPRVRLLEGLERTVAYMRGELGG